VLIMMVLTAPRLYLRWYQARSLWQQAQVARLPVSVMLIDIDQAEDRQLTGGAQLRVNTPPEALSPGNCGRNT
jgi:hypothetical protein